MQKSEDEFTGLQVTDLFYNIGGKLWTPLIWVTIIKVVSRGW